MKYGEALEALERGERVARSVWNGKNMWLAYMPGRTIPAGQVNTRTRRFLPEGDLFVGAYLVLYTAQGIWQPGWLPSQPDQFADDWQILPTPRSHPPDADGSDTRTTS